MLTVEYGREPYGSYLDTGLNDGLEWMVTGDEEKVLV